MMTYEETLNFHKMNCEKCKGNKGNICESNSEYDCVQESDVKALEALVQLKKAKEEMIKEHNLCFDYIIKANINKKCTKEEMLAYEIASSTMQTLGFIIGLLED